MITTLNEHRCVGACDYDLSKDDMKWEKFRHDHGSSPNVSFWESPAGDKNKVDKDNSINWGGVHLQ